MLINLFLDDILPWVCRNLPVEEQITAGDMLLVVVITHSSLVELGKEVVEVVQVIDITIVAPDVVTLLVGLSEDCQNITAHFKESLLLFCLVAVLEDTIGDDFESKSILMKLFRA
jgi:hypothetical protein